MVPRQFEYRFQIPQSYLDCILEGVLHCFFFHRLGNARPGSIEILGSSVPTLRTSQVTERVQEFKRAYLSSGTSRGRLRFTLHSSGSEITFRNRVRPDPADAQQPKIVSTALEWITGKATTTDVSYTKHALEPPWEVWVVDIDTYPDSRRVAQDSQLTSASQQLALFLLRVVQFAALTSPDHPMTNTMIVPYAVDIELTERSPMQAAAMQRRPSYMGQEGVNLEALENLVRSV